jgi:hypothetical protein
MLVYIAGGMRGLPGCNFEAFDKAEDLWVAAGHRVYSPANLSRAFRETPSMGDDPSTPAAHRHLRHVIQTDMACLYTVDAIVLLPGWQTSIGASLELCMAQFLGLPIYDAYTMEEIIVPSKPWSLLSVCSMKLPTILTEKEVS